MLITTVSFLSKELKSPLPLLCPSHVISNNQQPTSTMQFSQGSVKLVATTFFVYQANSLVANVVLASNDMVINAADAGILQTPKPTIYASTMTGVDVKNMSTPSSGTMEFAIMSKCTVGYIDCHSGYFNGDSSISCADACKGECCVGKFACDRFTGKVCQDGSCVEELACESAEILLGVVESCKGDMVCVAADLAGTLGKIVNSCMGEYACNRLGLNGIAGDVIDSCNAGYACFDGGALNGAVGNIKKSWILN